MEFCQTYDCLQVHALIPLYLTSRQLMTGAAESRAQRTRFRMNVGNVQSTGMNQSVRLRLPSEPARNVYASLLWGSPRVAAVTAGMYVIAQSEPTTHTLKYGERNQSCCDCPAFTRNSQKQSSARSDAC